MRYSKQGMTKLERSGWSGLGLRVGLDAFGVWRLADAMALWNAIILQILTIERGKVRTIR
jgi:hypothetical protein